MTLKDDIETVDAAMQIAARYRVLCRSDIEALRRIITELGLARDSLRWMVKRIEYANLFDSKQFNQGPSVELQAAKGLLERLEGI